MNPERWRQVSALFQQALDHDPADRARMLREATINDPDLLREVQSLLDTHGASADFLEEPAWQVAADLILDDELAPGDTLGPYCVRQEIGRGGMGIVYAAFDERLGRVVALKALPPEWAADARRRERLTREARAAAALSHPAIATVYALEEIDGRLYLVSELVTGRTLRAELAGGPLDDALVVPTLCDLASAMAAAHAAGIVHRDLKPENILRREDGQVKILDFGLARQREAAGSTRLTEAGLPLGTPGYMSPEQAAGLEADERSDIFSFGVVAWEAITGVHPLRSDADARRPPPGSTRTELLAVAGRCLQARPEDRYQRAADVVAALRGIQSGDPPARAAGWWWQFHQGAIAALNTAAPVTAWAARGWIDRPYGSWLFYSVLVLATISVTLRLNLLFTARVHPGTLRAHHARTYPAVLGADALLALALGGGAAWLAGAHDELGAVLLIFAVVMVVSLALVEPATTRAARIEKG